MILSKTLTCWCRGRRLRGRRIITAQFSMWGRKSRTCQLCIRKLWRSSKKVKPLNSSLRIHWSRISMRAERTLWKDRDLDRKKRGKSYAMKMHLQTILRKVSRSRDHRRERGMQSVTLSCSRSSRSKSQDAVSRSLPYQRLISTFQMVP